MGVSDSDKAVAMEARWSDFNRHDQTTGPLWTGGRIMWFMS